MAFNRTPSRDNTIHLRGRWLMIMLAVVPTLIFYSVWLVYPMGSSFWMSLHDWNPLAKEHEFIGLDNYREALYDDPLVKTTFETTFKYTFIAIPLGGALALAIAVMINSLPRLVGLFRTIYFVPVVTPIVAASIIWNWLYQGRFGFFNQILRRVGVEMLGMDFNPSVRWLTSKELALPSVMAMTTWQGVGFTMVIFLAGLTSIPTIFYEAAKIDGANVWQQFRHITVPLLRPTIIFVMVTGVISGMQIFTPMYVMTEGGPVNTTRTVVMHLYIKAFTTFRFGYASSVAFLLFIVLIIVTVLQFRFLRTRWEF